MGISKLNCLDGVINAQNLIRFYRQDGRPIPGTAGTIQDLAGRRGPAGDESRGGNAVFPKDQQGQPI